MLSVASFQILPDSRPSLELVQYLTCAGPPANTATNQAGSIHLCLTTNDLRACCAALKTQGVRFRSEPVTISAGPNAGGLVFYFYDPDGHVLELFQPACERQASASFI